MIGDRDREACRQLANKLVIRVLVTKLGGKAVITKAEFLRAHSVEMTTTTNDDESVVTLEIPSELGPMNVSVGNDNLPLATWRAIALVLVERLGGRVVLSPADPDDGGAATLGVNAFGELVIEARPRIRPPHPQSN